MTTYETECQADVTFAREERAFRLRKARASVLAASTTEGRTRTAFLQDARDYARAASVRPATLLRWCADAGIDLDDVTDVLRAR